MKNGKKPTRVQKKRLINIGLDPNEWFIIKNLPNGTIDV